MSRKAWIRTLAAIGLVALLVGAWIDGGRRSREWIEEPVAVPVAVE